MNKEKASIHVQGIYGIIAVLMVLASAWICLDIAYRGYGKASGNRQASGLYQGMRDESGGKSFARRIEVWLLNFHYRMEMPKDELAARKLLHEYFRAQNIYKKKYRRFASGPAELAAVGKLFPELKKDLILLKIACRGGIAVDGYVFSLPGEIAGKQMKRKIMIKAEPEEYALSGRKSFFLDNTGNIESIDLHGEKHLEMY